MKWAVVCGGMFFVYFLWAFSKGTNTRNVVKDNVRRVKRDYRTRHWIVRKMPLERDDREDVKVYAYEKMLDDTEELLL